MVLELKALADPDKEDKEGDEPSKAEPTALAAEGAEAEASADGALVIPFTIKEPLSSLHDETLALMSFAAKLSFSLIPYTEIDARIGEFWDALVRPFFSCAELEPAGHADAMETDSTAEPTTKPVVFVAAEFGEEAATREAKPPQSHRAMPLSYPKSTSQVLLGNSHLYIFVRLYHIVMERLAAAREMAKKASRASGDEDMAEATENKAATHGAANGSAAASELSAVSLEQEARRQTIAKLKDEAGGDLYLAFLAALRQLVEAKLEASSYEDILRTLLGSNAYILFTLHKILSQALKQLQMLLVEDASRQLVELYGYERQRVACGSMAESTYRNNVRLVLEGDEAFCVEQAYAKEGGQLSLSFLRERDSLDDEEDGEEAEDEADQEEEEEEEAAAAAGEGGAAWAQYMDSFVEGGNRVTPFGRAVPKRSRPVMLARQLKRQVR